MTAHKPLAERLRPTTLADIAGQGHLLAKGKPLARLLSHGQLRSCLLWGPPGVGKTTLARLMASHVEAHFIALSAVSAGVKDLRLATEEAKARLRLGQRTLMFIDEVHRFNKAQQDYLLPFVEDGTLIFVGATTENPSFEINPALRSRCQLYVLKALSDDDIRSVLERAVRHPEGVPVSIDDDAMSLLVAWSQGDARRALSALEVAVENLPESYLSLEATQAALSEKTLAFDKAGEHFYNLISALHKSVRGCHVDAALYYLARMLEAGADPLYLARRLLRMASEDVGLADPNALRLVLAAKDTVMFLGLAEGELALAQATVYLALAPKSNAIYTAYNEAKQAAHDYADAEVPLALRNAPTALLKKLDYGKAYHYYFDDPEASFQQQYLPDGLVDRQFYQPRSEGWESKVADRLAYFKAMRQKSTSDS